jgi:hypothetical protein
MKINDCDPDTSSLDGRPLILWLISVYDRTANERFPFRRKWYRFNYERATHDQVVRVLTLLSRRQVDPLPNAPPLAINETRVSYSLGGIVYTATEILDFRRLFDHVSEEEIELSLAESSKLLDVNLPHDSYFEDESENPISLLEVFDEEASRKSGKGSFSIVFDIPATVLRIGPAEPERAELWNSADAGLLAHLQDVYRQLGQSQWLRSSCVVSPVSETEVHSLLPTTEACMAVVLPFRQLYSKDSMDDLFNRSCKVHNRHCPKNHPAHVWVEYYKNQFNSQLEDSVRFPMPDCELSAKRYLDAFAYGARVVHSTGKKKEPEADLNWLLSLYPREMVIMGYHSILNQLLQTVSMVIPVLRQNVDHWIQTSGWASPTTGVGRRLFEP